MTQPRHEASPQSICAKIRKGATELAQARVAELGCSLALLRIATNPDPPQPGALGEQHVRRCVPNHDRTVEIDAAKISLSAKRRTDCGLSAIAACRLIVGTMVDAIDSSAAFSDLVEHPLMDELQIALGHEPPSYSTLVGDDHDDGKYVSERTHRVEYARQELEFVPFPHVLVGQAAIDHAVSIQEKAPIVVDIPVL
jgi:hypothetical protein